MQSPRQSEEYYHKDKERNQEEERSPTTTEEQKDEIIESTTPLAAVKNKKRVHYPHTNGEHLTVDTEKTDSLQQNHTKSPPGT